MSDPSDPLYIPDFLRMTPERLARINAGPSPKYQLSSMASEGKLKMSRTAEEIKQERRAVAQAAAPAIQEAIAAGAWTMSDLRKALPDMRDDQIAAGVELLKARKRTGELAVKANKPPVTRKPGEQGAGRSKNLIIKELLQRKEGCTSKDVLAATGWPAVSMPAQAKVCGLTLRKVKEPGKPTVYFGS